MKVIGFGPRGRPGGRGGSWSATVPGALAPGYEPSPLPGSEEPSRIATRPATGSPDPPGDVGLGAGVLGVGEEAVGGGELGDHAGAVAVLARLVEHQAGGQVADPAGLLHVVGDDHDRVL